MFLSAGENRYEGSWKNGKKNGPGKFFYLDRGQLYEGVWVDDVPKCGEMTDFGRDCAPAPTQYPIPKVFSLRPESEDHSEGKSTSKSAERLNEDFSFRYNWTTQSTFSKKRVKHMRKLTTDLMPRSRLELCLATKGSSDARLWLAAVFRRPKHVHARRRIDRAG